MKNEGSRIEGMKIRNQQILQELIQLDYRLQALLTLGFSFTCRRDNITFLLNESIIHHQSSSIFSDQCTMEEIQSISQLLQGGTNEDAIILVSRLCWYNYI